MRFTRPILGVLAAVLLAVACTTMGIVVGRRTQQIEAAAAQHSR